jgi:6-phospho-beta-glucosidase
MTSRKTGLKITVIGGGSTYTPELVNGFLSMPAPLPLAELWLMDTDAERLEIVGNFCRRVVQAKGTPFKVLLSSDQRASISNSDYVITQFRVGKMAARRGDEYLGRRHGLIGQETTGVGGMAKALRTIPVILQVAGDIRETAPGALLLNFTNPSGLVMEALARHAQDVAAVGVCNVGITTQMFLLKKLEEMLGEPIEASRVQLDTLGLNHLSWHRGFSLDGKDTWQQLFPALVEENRKGGEHAWDEPTLTTLGMIPNDYLRHYYYTRVKISEQEKWPPSRAEQVMEIEKDLLKEFADLTLVHPPPGLMLRGGAFYSTLATRVIRSHHLDLAETHILNVPNLGAVREWPEDWVLELPAVVKKNGISPLPARPLPAVCFGLLAQVKCYELLAVEAAVHGDRKAASQALLCHPLGPPADEVPSVLDDMLLTNRQWLPQFN